MAGQLQSIYFSANPREAWNEQKTEPPVPRRCSQTVGRQLAERVLHNKAITKQAFKIRHDIADHKAAVVRNRLLGIR